MIDLKNSLSKRFIYYTTFDTMSDPSKSGMERPTTASQEVLLNELKKELEELGIDTYYGHEKVLMGSLKGNCGDKTIGFMAHVDTADDVEGNHVKAQRWQNYDGKDIKLNGLVLSPDEDPELSRYIGSEIITSDGTTLLGSDDKAGVAIIMEGLSYLVEHPEIKRPNIEVYFTPDEETGSGMSLFPYQRLKSYCCYTIDGGTEGVIETECFNAATVSIKLKGVSIHLGSARGIMVNAITMASQIVATLPQAESPEATDGRYGYYCPLDFSGTASEAKLDIFIRDFDLKNFEYRIEAVKSIASSIALLYRGQIECSVKVSYHNMAEANGKNPMAVDAIYEAGKKLGIAIKSEVIRGGTDGARLAETGVACPNIFTGGHNLHSLKEWVAVDGMNTSLNLMLGIVDYWSQK